MIKLLSDLCWWVVALVLLVWSNGYWSCVGGSVAIAGFGVFNWLWELCWWGCSYCCGCCDEMFMRAVWVGVQLLVGPVCSNGCGSCVGGSVAIGGAGVIK